MVISKPRLRSAMLSTLVACLLVAPPAVANAHPLHTSLAEIGYDPKTGSILVSLRVFVDDFTAASNAYRQRLVSANPRARSQSPLVSYALETFKISDDAGRQLPLESCGGKRVGDLMWLCFRARVASPPKSLRVSNRILFEMYKDQINVVQATLGPRKSSALFTPGDGSKQLR